MTNAYNTAFSPIDESPVIMTFPPTSYSPELSGISITFTLASDKLHAPLAWQSEQADCCTIRTNTE